MGAAPIQEAWLSKDLTAKEVFDELHRRDRYEYGNGGYTGSWAEVPGIDVPFSPDVPIPLKAAVRLADDRFERGLVRKWEAGEAVPICADGDVIARTVKTKVVLTGESYMAVAGDGYRLAGAALKAATFPMKTGERILDATVVDVKVKQTITAEPGGGLLVSEFVATGRNKVGYKETVGVYPDLVTAKKAARVVLRDSGFRDVAIIKHQRRETGPLVALSAEVREATMTLVVEVGRVKAGAKRAGWYLWALASS